MAAEEFQESEIVFSDQRTGFKEMNRQNNSRSNGSNKKKKKKSNSCSVAVNIPGSNALQLSDGGDEFEDELDGEEMIPPHIIVRRRIEGKMEFSVCSGNGRTLKGRDLSEVRNSILRWTGFLET